MSSGFGARVDNLRLRDSVRTPRVDLAADFASLGSRRLAFMSEMLTDSRYGVFTISVKSSIFRRQGRRLVRVFYPDRSELASA